MAGWPTGTVTFLFTDIEGSSRLWERDPEGMRSAPSRHVEILREAIDDRGEYVFKTVGDAFCAAHLSDMDLPLQRPYRSFVRSRLDRAAFEAAIGEGRNMTPRQDIDYALEDERGAGSRTRVAPA